jgi:hypothetical protein
MWAIARLADLLVKQGHVEELRTRAGAGDPYVAQALDKGKYHATGSGRRRCGPAVDRTRP